MHIELEEVQLSRLDLVFNIFGIANGNILGLSKQNTSSLEISSFFFDK